MAQDETPFNLEPEKEYESITVVENDDLNQRDMLTFISSVIDENGLIGHNIQGYNDLIHNGIKKIITSLFSIDKLVKNDRTKTAEDSQIEMYQIEFSFNDIQVGFPVYTDYNTSKFADLFPMKARLNGLPYSGPITLSANVSIKAHFKDNHIEQKTVAIPNFQIGSFPIMFGSDRCHTVNCTRAALKEMGEDPNDGGGYLIIKRQEYTVDLSENIRYNSPHIHNNIKGEHCRVEFLSQPNGAFENSSLLRIKYLLDGSLVIEINSVRFEKVKIPFFIIYRIFGMTDDKDIVNTIVFDIEDKSSNTLQICNILQVAFHKVGKEWADLVGEINSERIIKETAEKIQKYLSNPSTYQNNESVTTFLNNDLLKTLDKVVLPHMGQTADSRIKKLLFLGMIINKLFLVHMGILEPTDRDSYKNKRVHGPGVSLAKAFKTQFNNNSVSPAIIGLRKLLKDTPWSSITSKLIASTFQGAMSIDLNTAMEKAILASNKVVVIKGQVAHNRVSSQVLERKNQLNAIASLRNITSSSGTNSAKQTMRANLMRRVHPTFLGFICISQSLDTGEGVGMRKQLAITANVCTASDAAPLKLYLLNDPNIISLNDLILSDVVRLNLAKVFINGEWIGCCTKPYEIVNKYRLLRREQRVVDIYASISWDVVTNEIEFWMDVGRIRRPVLIVYNNIKEYDEALHVGKKIEFVQNIRFLKSHAKRILSGELKFEELVKDGIVEYITPEEQENCFLAESIIDLRNNRNNICKQYTHCEIEQAVLGVAALKSPYGNNTQPARVTYETNQARQTCGWYALNFAERTDKIRFFQFYNETPLVRTLADTFTLSNGMNCIVAYMCKGNNEEDSTIVSQAALDRGLFAGAFFRFDISELEKGEIFCNPDPTTTKGMKPGGNYEKLVNGLIPKNTIVHKNLA